MHSTRLLSALYLAVSFVAVSGQAISPATITPSPLLPRQDNGNSNSDARPSNNNANTSQNTPTNNDKPNQTQESKAPSTTEDQGGLRGVATAPPDSANRGSGGDKTSKPIAINPIDPAGGIQMQTPGVFDGVQYYKLGQKITFGFNMTSVMVTPTAINVEAYCSGNSKYYTITTSAPPDITKVVWDTAQTTDGELMMTSYAFVVYDAEKPKSAVGEAGYLAPFTGAQFAIYSPRKAQTMEEFKCPGCNSASALFNSHAFRVLLGTSFMVVFGFTWFLAGTVF
jgi:hypothetical protein